MELDSDFTNKKVACEICKQNIGIDLYHDRPGKCYSKKQSNTTMKPVSNDDPILSRLDRIEETMARWNSVLDNNIVENKSKPVYTSFSMIPEFVPSSQLLEQLDSTQSVPDLDPVDKITNQIAFAYNSLNNRLERIENRICGNSKFNRNPFDRHRSYTASNSLTDRYSDNQTDLGSDVTNRTQPFNRFERTMNLLKETSSEGEFYRESNRSSAISSGDSINYFIKHYRPFLSPSKGLAPPSLHQSANSLCTISSEDRVFESLNNFNPHDYFITKTPIGRNSPKELIHFNKNFDKSSFIDSNLLEQVKSETSSLNLERKRKRLKSSTADSI